jgi:hypothetical protein
MSSISSAEKAPRNARLTIAFAGRSNSENSLPERSRQCAAAASRDGAIDGAADADDVLIEVPDPHKPG